MTFEERYRIAESVAWVDSVEGQSPGVGDGETAPEAWVVALPDGQALALNGPGLEIWLACADADADADADTDGDSDGIAARGGVTLDDIVRRVRESTGNPDVPAADVATFLGALVVRGLVERQYRDTVIDKGFQL